MTKGEKIKAPNAPKHGENPIPVCVRMGNQDSSRALMIPDDSIPIVETGKSSCRSLTLQIPFVRNLAWRYLVARNAPGLSLTNW
jgi:hypothetical protein